MKHAILLPIALTSVLFGASCASLPGSQSQQSSPASPVATVATDIMQAYLSGQNLMQKGSFMEALAPLTKAAVAEYLPAKVALALDYFGGLKDMQQGNQWLQNAFAQNKDQALDSLKEFASKDNLQAKILAALTQAQDSGNEQSWEKYTNLLQSALHQDKKGALDFITQLAQQNANPEAQMTLGNLFYTGQGLQQDYTKAAEWFKKAANNGNVDSQLNLSEMLEAGLGVQQNKEAAIEYLKKAAEKNDLRALYSLGEKAQQANDLKQALQYFKQGASLGDPAAIDMAAKVLKILQQHVNK